MSRSAIFALLVLTSCSSSEDDSSSAPPADCATQAAPLDAGVYAPDAIPKGPCSNEGQRCAMKIGYACANGSLGRVDGAQCTCQSGAWSCAITNGGTSSCPSTP